MTRRKILKYVPYEEKYNYQGKGSREVFALHPVNKEYRPSNNKIVLGKNVIIDGHHQLYKLIFEGIQEIEVYMYKDIVVYNNLLYSPLYGIKKMGEIPYYAIGSHGTYVYYLYDETDDELYSIYLPYVYSDEMFFKVIKAAQDIYNIRCFFNNISFKVENTDPFFYDSCMSRYMSGCARVVANGVINYNGERFLVNAEVRHSLNKFGKEINEGPIILKDASLDETRNVLKLNEEDNPDNICLNCYLADPK